MKFNFRKIASALASTAMVSSTVALAAAANFPAPFVENGAADVAIVYGNSLDLAAVTDVQTALSSELASTSTGGTAGAASDEAYLLATSSSPLLLNASVNSVRSSVSEANLPSVLGEVEFSGNVDADMTYKIVLGSYPRVVFDAIPTSSDDPQVGIALSTSTSNYLYNATITFDQAVNLTHADSEGEDIMLFGQEFQIATSTTGTSLVLFKSAAGIFLDSETNPSEVIDLEGETYTVELVAATDTSATLRVTDSSGSTDLKEISESASKKILGVEFSVKTADESTATNKLQADIIAGAEKYTFADGSGVTVGSDNTEIDGTNVDFTGNVAALTGITVQVTAADGNEDAILPGGEFVDPVFGSFRLYFEGLGVEDEDREDISVKTSGVDKMTVSFTTWEGDEIENFEFLNNETGDQLTSFLGDSNEWRLVVREMGQINESGYAVVGNEVEGRLVELQQLSNQTTGYNNDVVKFVNVGSGQDYNGIIDGEGTADVSIGDDYVITYVDDRAGDGAQHVRLNWPESTGNNMIVYPTIETSKGAKLAFYEPLTIDLSNWDGAGNDLAGVMFPDGNGYTTITAVPGTGSGGDNVTIDGTLLNATSTATVTVGQLTYTFDASTSVNQTTIYLNDVDSGSTITRPGIMLFEEEDDANLYQALIVQTAGGGDSNNGVGVSDVDFTWNTDTGPNGDDYANTGLQRESNDDLYDMMDIWGTMVTTDQSDSDQFTSVISYPDNQVKALLYADSLVQGSGSTTTLGEIKVMDNELETSGMQTKNLIIVGGSCVSNAAKTLVGATGTGCEGDWTTATGAGTGEWIIQTFENPWASSKVATVVAGWEAPDTQNAATYLTTQDVEIATGEKLQGSTADAAVSVTV